MSALRQVDPLRIGVRIVDETGGPTPDFMRNFNGGYANAASLDNAKVDATTQVIAGAGLTGGGDLSEDRTFDVGAGTGITVNANDVAIDLTAEAERIRDTMGTALVQGAGITITPNDGADTITIASAITQYTDEQAQDAVGAMVDASLVYVDATPLLQRAALTGDVTASAGSNATTIASDAVTFAKMLNATAASVLIGRGSASGAGDFQEITLGSGLAMTGTVLSSSGGSSGSWIPTVDGAEPPAFITDGAGVLILVAGP